MEAAELQKLCRLNLASCYLHSCENLHVIGVCNEVLDAHSDHFADLIHKSMAGGTQSLTHILLESMPSHASHLLP